MSLQYCMSESNGYVAVCTQHICLHSLDFSRSSHRGLRSARSWGTRRVRLADQVTADANSLLWSQLTSPLFQLLVLLISICVQLTGCCFKTGCFKGVSTQLANLLFVIVSRHLMELINITTPLSKS